MIAPKRKGTSRRLMRVQTRLLPYWWMALLGPATLCSLCHLPPCNGTFDYFPKCIISSHGVMLKDSDEGNEPCFEYTTAQWNVMCDCYVSTRQPFISTLFSYLKDFSTNNRVGETLWNMTCHTGQNANFGTLYSCVYNATNTTIFLPYISFA